MIDIALLRGINVGGKNKLGMRQLPKVDKRSLSINNMKNT